MMLTRLRCSLTTTLLVAGLVAKFTLLDSPRPARAQAPRPAQAPQALPRGPVAIPDQYIVAFKPGVNPGQAASQMARQHGLGLRFVYTDAVRGFAAVVPAGRLRALQNDPRVAHVEPDRVVSAFDHLPTGVDRVDAELSGTAAIGTRQNVNVDIAILDTGIDPNHPDLNIAGGYNTSRGPSHKWADDNGHGTHVAGTAAARDNGTGVVGVAPGARLWAVKVLDRNGSGSLSGIIAGLDWVTANAGTIEVANMSLGFAGTSSTLDRAIANSVSRGVVYAVAAGNSADDAGYYSPARHPDVLCVSAINDIDGQPGGIGGSNWAGSDDTFAYFSNNSSVVDIAAPGVDIVSTVPGGYAYSSGTSMAAPHVAGAAALYMATRPRDVNGDGKVDQKDAYAVQDALIGAAAAQDGADGFGGDVDGDPEPLANVRDF